MKKTISIFNEPRCMFVFSLFQVVQAVWNLTTNERLNRHRYEYLKDGVGNYYNPYSRGWRTNILEFLHLKRPLDEKDVHHLNICVV